MLLIALITIVALIVGIALQARDPRWSGLACAALIVALVVVPKQIFQAPTDLQHTGIAPDAPSAATYTILIVAVAYALLLQALLGSRERYASPIAYVFLAWLAVEYLFVWRGSDAQLAGIEQLAVGWLAWIAGAFLCRRVVDSQPAMRILAVTLLGTLACEAIVTILQRVGLHIHPMAPALAAIMGKRTNGTTPHPDQLGKAILLLTILALGLLGTAEQRVRRILWAAIIVGFIPQGLSQGRANGIAEVLTLVVWSALLPRSKPLSARIGVPAMAVVLAVPFVPAVAKRFDQDPKGGARADLAQTSYHQIAMRPVWGLGANSYVSVVAPYDVNTAAGYPVHNGFLLTVAELGIPAAALFWVPLLLLLLAAWRARRFGAAPGAFGQVLVASAPGLYLVLLTGWGMFQGQILPLWFLVLGTIYGQVRHGRLRRDAPGGAEPSLPIARIENRPYTAPRVPTRVGPA